ncbi:uncharacterized protein LOC131597499 [Vicia villosa]|uniref:uncharacterized protein LOC131597499 n=1 Tax=Vicia villosa TaxID=3911 RepID=UPI00273C8882|nr:uncharacterized protein LOC131597499 [Vicia villosa]
MECNRVKGRRFRNYASQWDSFPFSRAQVESSEVISSIFFSEFLERIRAADIFKLFGCIGDVVEVVILPRRNKMGKRYGFARFRGVKDSRLLAVKLDSFFIDGRKIHANISRIDRGLGDAFWRRLGYNEGAAVLRRGDSMDGMSSFVGVKYFANIVSEGKKKVVHDAHSSFAFSFKPKHSNQWKKAFVGEVLFSSESFNIQTHLEVKGISVVKVCPIGANLFLLEETAEGMILYLISEGSSRWKQWFRSIRPWRTSDVDSVRLAWIHVHGIPCHAWCFEFFGKIANYIGTFVSVDENTMKGSNRDITRFMVRVPVNFVLKERIIIDIDGVEFDLVMREDLYGAMKYVKRLGSDKG